VFRTVPPGATVGSVIVDVLLMVLVLLGPAVLPLLVPKPRLHRRLGRPFRGRHRALALIA
jgi:hypothetical protein